MSLWYPSPPQGKTSEQGLHIIGKPISPIFAAPQGIASGIPSPQETPFLNQFPPLGNITYDNYKFYQVNQGEFQNEVNNFIWEITDSVGPGVFLEPSGFDIRVFLQNEDSLPPNLTPTGNTFEPILGTNINTFQMSPDKLHLFAWAMTGNIIHEWVLSAPGIFPADGTPSDFTFDASTFETNARDITFVDDGNKFMILGISSDVVSMFSLDTPNSFATPPVLLSQFSAAFLDFNPSGCDFSPDGTNLIILAAFNDVLHQWTGLTPFTFPTPSQAPDRSFNYNPDVVLSVGNCRYSKDGKFLYILSRNPERISKYTLTDGPFLIPIVNKLSEEIVLVDVGDTRCMSLLDDETTIYISSRDDNIVYEFITYVTPLQYEVTSVNVTTGDFTIKILNLTLKDLDYIQIIFGNISAVDGSTVLGAGTTLSTFESPLLTKDIPDLISPDGVNDVLVETV